MALVPSSSQLRSTHGGEERPVPRETELSRFILAETPSTTTPVGARVSGVGELTKNHTPWTMNKVRLRFQALSFLDNSSPLLRGVAEEA